jgi:hypothetical protein
MFLMGARALAGDGRFRLDVSGGCAMKSRGPERVCVVLALLAFSVIAYVVTPPAVLKQATAFLGFD